MSAATNQYQWQGRIDPEDGDLGIRFHQVVSPFTTDSTNGVSLIGLASDLGVKRNQGRIGASAGPNALRSALANLAWHGDTAIYDAGDIDIAPTSTKSPNSDPLQQAQQNYANRVCQALEQTNFVVGMGGGHEIAWGSYLGCRQFLEQSQQSSQRIGILNFDAHFDLRTTPDNVAWQGSSGTPFRQVWQDRVTREQPFDYACIGISQAANTRALFQFAESNQVNYLLDEHCNQQNVAALINSFIAGLDALYLTVCLDVLPASVAPGVSAPAALGINLPTLLNGIKQVQLACQQHKVSWLMADIAELNPQFDVDNQTAKVAARLAYQLIQAHQCKQMA